MNGLADQLRRKLQDLKNKKWAEDLAANPYRGYDFAERFTGVMWSKLSKRLDELSPENLKTGKYQFVLGDIISVTSPRYDSMGWGRGTSMWVKRKYLNFFVKKLRAEGFRVRIKLVKLTVEPEHEDPTQEFEDFEITLSF